MPRGGFNNRKGKSIIKPFNIEKDEKLEDEKIEKSNQEEDDLLNSEDEDPVSKNKKKSTLSQHTSSPGKVQHSSSSSQIQINAKVPEKNDDISDIVANITSTNAEASKKQEVVQIPEFTPTGKIDSLPLGSVTGIYVGIVYSVTGPSYANKSKVMHIVLYNNDGEYMQISAWGTVVDRLNPVIAHGKIMMAKGLKVIQSDRKSDYFFGNTDQHLQLIDSSNFKLSDMPKEQITARLESRNSKLEDVLLKDVLSKKGIIRVRGYLKIPFEFNRGSSNEIIATITDGSLILGVIIQSNVVPENMSRGHEVELIGEITENSRNDKHHILVRSLNDLKLVSPEKKSINFIMSAYKHL